MKNQNPRLEAMFRGQPLHLQFIAIALAAIMGEEATNTALDNIVPTEIDFTERVAGMPLHYWHGRPESSIRDEFRNAGRPDADADKAVADIRAAYTARGIPTYDESERATKRAAKRLALPPEASIPPAAPAALSTEGTTPKAPGSPTGEIMAPVVDPDAEPVEATAADTARVEPAHTLGAVPPGFKVTPPAEMKIAGRPYADFAGKSDADLRAMGNVGTRTISAVREYEAAAKAAGYTLPGPTPAPAAPPDATGAPAAALGAAPTPAPATPPGGGLASGNPSAPAPNSPANANSPTGAPAAGKPGA
jgi:hypothetical protein